jgi:hypothetical protein
MRIKRFLRISLFLLAVNLLAENVGYFTHQLYQFLGMALLCCYGLSIFSPGRRTERVALLLAGLVLLGVSLLFLSGSIPHRLAGAGIFLLGLLFCLRSRGEQAHEVPVLIVTVTAYFYFFLFSLYSPPFWLALKGISLSCSRAVGSLIGVPALFASTFLGLPVTVLMVIFILVVFMGSNRERPLLFILSLASLVVLNVFYLFVMEGMSRWGNVLMGLFSDPENFMRLFLGFLFEKKYPLAQCNYLMYGPLVLCLLYLIPSALILWRREAVAAGPRPNKGRLKYAAAFLLATVIAGSLLVVDVPGSPSPNRKVVLYDKGFLNWQIPNFSMFGSKSAGMFGMLPRFLEAMGFFPEKTGAITEEVLQGAKILMMINVDRELPSAELEVIWKFVQNGGSLLLLGDHTFYKHGVERIILNDVLQPFAIRYNFDSADWFVGGWLHSYHYAPHPVTLGMRDDLNDAGIVIGASLSVAPPAFPLIAGKYGYSDPGTLLAGDQRGYLGNLNYDFGEPLGDVVLCAAQHAGRGKVMVFGDTSAFANAILVNSHDFVNRVFTWLSKDESPRHYRMAFTLSLILLCSGLFFCFRSDRSPLLLLISLVLVLGVIKVAGYVQSARAERNLSGNIAYISASHGERFSPESWNENAILGLHLNLMRNEYLSLTMRSLKKAYLEHAKLLVLVAPSSPFTGKEIGWIDDFVQRGGVLMLSVGWEERDASVPLMAHFGFALDYLPLSQFMSIIPAANQRVRLYESWPVVSTAGGAEVVAAYQAYPVIMKKSHGKGWVVVIGDSSFFWNVNLEMEESHVRENVEFLRWFLSTVSAGGEVGG